MMGWPRLVLVAWMMAPWKVSASRKFVPAVTVKFCAAPVSLVRSSSLPLMMLE